MTFDEALQSSQLNVALQANGRALITKEAADYALAISKLEPISPGVFGFTHCCENSFEMFPRPNPNGHPEAILSWDFALGKLVSWDIGPLALNFMWTQRSVCAGEYSMVGLKWTDVFGSKFYDDDKVTPCQFNGDPIANGRVAARKLLALRGDYLTLGYDSLMEFQLCRYTGPEHQSRRLQLWKILRGEFSDFFSQYQNA